MPGEIPWTQVAGPLAVAEDALARLDERLRSSQIHDGFLARQNFTDACALLWFDSEQVHHEDLVLHDAGMDIRAPTHELLRVRRRIFSASPD